MATPQLAPGRPQPAPVVTNAAGAATMAALYTEALKALPFPYECLWVETSFDRTHVVVAGPADAPPVVVFHGTASPGPFQLAGVGAELVKHCRLYVPDIPGQGGSRSDNALLDPALHRHGTWAGEVVAALGLLGPGDARPPLGIGISLGAAVLLDLAVTCPQAVRGAALIAPVCLYPGGSGGRGEGRGGGMRAAGWAAACSCAPPATCSRPTLGTWAAGGTCRALPAPRHAISPVPRATCRHRRGQVDAGVGGAGIPVVPPDSVPPHSALCAVALF